MPKIYTKVGDQGETCLLGKQGVSKDDARLEACGGVDELNSILGIIRSIHLPIQLETWLQRIQKELLAMGSELASPRSVPSRLTDQHTKRLELEIDQIEEELPPLHNFILPGGGPIASRLHLARTVCRRVERRVVALNRLNTLNPALLIYLNRLSDWLFVMSRYSTRLEGGSDILWQGTSEDA